MSYPTIPSPYNFATVEDRVVLLDEKEYPSNDIPFCDGLSGSISVEFEATRPIFVRSAGQHDKDRIASALGDTGNNPQEILSNPDLEPYSRFYQLPNGETEGVFALPGTSVKGMLRAVVEILSFSRMFGVEDETFSFRPPKGKKQAFRRSTIDCLPGSHKIGSGTDIAEAIFGKIAKEKTDVSFRGRVNVEPFSALNNPIPMLPHVAVLNGPKASYYPNYIVQKVESSGVVKQYVTYDDNEARLRGWKRYPARVDNMNSRPLDNDPPAKDGEASNYSIATVFAPLPPGTRFKGVVHFHNLRPWEFGALLWAIRLGHAGLPEQNQRRHSIGMAKPLGCGLMKLNSIDLSVSPIVSTSLSTEAEYMAEFERFVLAKLGDTGTSYRNYPQVKDLLAMASIKKPKDPQVLTYPNPVKEFAEYKKQRWILQPFENLPSDPHFRSSKTPPPMQSASQTSPASHDAVTTEVAPASPGPLPQTQIKIIGQNKNLKWQALVMDGSIIQCGLVEGILPTDIAAEKIYSAEVLGDTPKQWRFRILPS